MTKSFRNSPNAIDGGHWSFSSLYKSKVSSILCDQFFFLHFSLRTQSICSFQIILSLNFVFHLSVAIDVGYLKWNHISTSVEEAKLLISLLVLEKRNCLPKNYYYWAKIGEKIFWVEQLLNIMKNDEESRCIISKCRLAMPGIPIVDWIIDCRALNNVTASIFDETKWK